MANDFTNYIIEKYNLQKVEKTKESICFHFNNFMLIVSEIVLINNIFNDEKDENIYLRVTTKMKEPTGENLIYNSNDFESISIPIQGAYEKCIEFIETQLQFLKEKQEKMENFIKRRKSFFDLFENHQQKENII